MTPPEETLTVPVDIDAIKLTTEHESIIDHDIVVFSKTHCVQCDQTLRVLTRNGHSPHLISLEDDNIRLSDQQYQTPFQFCTQTLSAITAPVVLVRTELMKPTTVHPQIYNEFTVWTGFRPDMISLIAKD